MKFQFSNRIVANPANSANPGTESQRISSFSEISKDAPVKNEKAISKISEISNPDTYSNNTTDSQISRISNLGDNIKRSNNNIYQNRISPWVANPANPANRKKPEDVITQPSFGEYLPDKDDDAANPANPANSANRKKLFEIISQATDGIRLAKLGKHPLSGQRLTPAMLARRLTPEDIKLILNGEYNVAFVRCAAESMALRPSEFSIKEQTR